MTTTAPSQEWKHTLVAPHRPQPAAVLASDEARPHTQVNRPPRGRRHERANLGYHPGWHLGVVVLFRCRGRHHPPGQAVELQHPHALVVE
jgi:hypothetical protein